SPQSHSRKQSLRGEPPLRSYIRQDQGSALRGRRRRATGRMAAHTQEGGLSTRHKTGQRRSPQENQRSSASRLARRGHIAAGKLCRSSRVDLSFLEGTGTILGELLSLAGRWEPCTPLCTARVVCGPLWLFSSPAASDEEWTQLDRLSN